MGSTATLPDATALTRKCRAPFSMSLSELWSSSESIALRVSKCRQAASAGRGALTCHAHAQIDVCKLLSKFPRPMSACVRECFKRMPALDPELRARLAGWLALHLSNFEFMWPWERWRSVLDGPVYDPQR